MQSRINSLVLVCLMSITTAGFAEQAVSAQSFPYIAEITGDNVNIRSGAGTDYYDCGKLNAGDRVKVVSTKFDWSRIVPPRGSFSWISRQFVEVDPDVPTIGVVIGNSVRVWVGSKNYKPIHSTTNSTKLDKGERVRLLGPEQDGYYMIAPPPNVYRWVSTQFTVALGPDAKMPAVVDVEPEVRPTLENVELIGASEPSDREQFIEYYSLAKQVAAERAKPIGKQSYTAFKEKLTKLAKSKAGGKASRYAKFTFRQIKRYELALEAGEAVSLHEAQLKQAYERIEKARITRMQKVEDLGKFTVIGTLKSSTIYDVQPEGKRYQIVDQSGRVLCFIQPEGSAENIDLDALEDKRVGLIGTIHPHPQNIGALVRFTEVILLKQ